MPPQWVTVTLLPLRNMRPRWAVIPVPRGHPPPRWAIIRCPSVKRGCDSPANANSDYSLAMEVRPKPITPTPRQLGMAPTPVATHPQPWGITHRPMAIIPQRWGIIRLRASMLLRQGMNDGIWQCFLCDGRTRIRMARLPWQAAQSFVVGTGTTADIYVAFWYELYGQWSLARLYLGY